MFLLTEKTLKVRDEIARICIRITIAKIGGFTRHVKFIDELQCV
jgi:hypothetical protein